MNADMDYWEEQRFQSEVKAIAKDNGLPFPFCSQLIRTEINEGVAIPDALEWLKGIAPAFTGRVKP